MGSVATRPRRRSGGNAYQAEQRTRTREDLIAAGIEIFSRRPYFAATIDDLIGTAGVSRAAFYMHFESKLELALAVFDAGIAEWSRLFAKLPMADPGDFDTLRRWIGALMRLNRDRIYVVRLHAELDAFEPRFQARIDALQETLVDALGASMPGFALALRPTAEGRRARIAAKLATINIHKACAALAMRPPLPDEGTYLDVLTDTLLTFLNASTSLNARATDAAPADRARR